MIRVLILVLVFSVGAAHAELRKLTESDFRTNVVTLEPRLRDGADASAAFSGYGIFLSCYPSGSPTVRSWIDPVLVLPRVYPVVTNETTGNQSDSVLVVDFRSPVKKIGLKLNAAPPQEVSIDAVSPTGKSIGTLAQAVGELGTFVGFEDLNNQPISKVIIDFRSAETPERLAAVVIEAPSAPRFETVLPQIAHGKLGPDLFLRTSVSVVNFSNTTARGEIRFYGPDGQPLAPELLGAARHNNMVEFSLQPRQTKFFSTSGNDGTAGYARVVSNSPVQAIAHFMLTRRTEGWTETAVPAVKGRFEAVGAYNLQYPGATGAIGTVPPPLPSEPLIVGSALAIVNLSPDPTSVTVFLDDEVGIIREETFSLAPGEQRARFIDEIFGQLLTPQGTIRISSNRPLAAMLVKTINGLPVSILPLGSLED